MDVNKIIKKPIGMYSPIMWTWIFIGCTIAFMIDNLPFVYNNAGIFALIYIFGCLFFGRLQSTYKECKIESYPIVEKIQIFDMRNCKGWGNSIVWQDTKKRRIRGYLSQSERPKVGDEVRDELNNGKIGRFRVESVKDVDDPKDMFFATLSDIDYL